MIGLCKTVHSLLGFPDPDDRCRGAPRRHRSVPAPSDAAGLRCVAGHLPLPPPHVVESAALRPSPPPSPSPSTSASLLPLPSPSPQPQKEDQPRPMEWIDDGTRGLSYLYGCVGSGRLELCTERLGFESCCDGRMGPEEELAEQEVQRRIDEAGDQRGGDCLSKKTRPAGRRTEAKEFPPPLTWMRASGEGRCRSFLKAVRRDGRFMLTEVRIERPEIFRASRQGGSLRLELVRPEVDAVVAEEEETSETEDATAEMALGVEGGEETMAEESVLVAEEEAEEEKQEECAAAEVEEEGTRWQLPKAALDRRREGGGGFRRGRCQEVAREGLPSSPFWRSRFVTMA